jgi:ATP-dependent Clp protease ATP-binding subunit ClpB
MDSLRDYFKPEFLNRLDEIVIFHSLTEKQIETIVDLQLEKVIKRLAEKKISLDIAPEVKKHLADTGYDPNYGARPLKRAIQSELLDQLSLKIIEGDVSEGQKVKVKMDKGKIVIK